MSIGTQLKLQKEKTIISLIDLASQIKMKFDLSSNY